MHELSVATAVVETALRHADDRRVTAVTVRMGALRQVVPDSLRFYFEIVARDSECEGARLELIEVPARLRCSACGYGWEPSFPSFRCERCGSADTEVLSGQELEVEFIEVEEREPLCTGPR
jgi:hydrogenase nickel incorporation protein HypA/HybF